MIITTRPPWFLLVFHNAKKMKLIGTYCWQKQIFLKQHAIQILNWLQGVQKLIACQELSYISVQQNIRQDIYLPMCCPFILRHSLTLSGMPRINRSKISGEIADHALFTFWIKPFPLVAAGILSSSCWMMAYKFSIRFKSREFPGHWSFIQKELTFDWSHR